MCAVPVARVCRCDAECKIGGASDEWCKIDVASGEPAGSAVYVAMWDDVRSVVDP